MGRIASPHGVRGAVRVKAESETPAALLDHERWWLRPRSGGDWMPYRVAAAREHAGMLVVELAGVVSRDAAAALRGADVGVPRESLPPLRDDEYYQADLVGMQVVNRDGVSLGIVIEFAESGAHPILRIAGDDGRERLIPWVTQFIDGVDAPSRRIDVEWPADY